MSTRPPAEDHLPPQLAAARILSLGLGLLTLVYAAVMVRDGRTLEAILLAGIGLFASACLYVLLRGLQALLAMAQVNRYRAERDQELATLLTEIHRMMAAAGWESGTGAQKRSGVFQSSMMPFSPEDDGALTGKRPSLQE
jgi:uncharacterized membrane protein